MVKSTSEMNCDVHRGDENQQVYHMNNWLSNQAGLSDPTQAGEANDVDFLVERANECWAQHENTYLHRCGLVGRRRCSKSC